LKEAYKGRSDIRFLELHQLDPTLAEDLREASSIIFIDASLEEIEGGWQWGDVKPELSRLHYLSHFIDPSFLMGMMESLYQQIPASCLVSIQGDDFGMGERLTPAAEKRANKAIAGISSFIETNSFLDS